MTRLYGRSLGGKRCCGHMPFGHWKSMTMLSSIRFDGTTECLVFDGAINKKIFDEYIIKILCPTLKSGDVVVMDNLPAHKSARAKAAIEACGASICYLPPYSPDLNPIEKMWSKVKQILRGIKARSREALEKGIAYALDQVTHEDVKGWFASCGYIKSQY